jgi:hypothetical protein
MEAPEHLEHSERMLADVKDARRTLSQEDVESHAAKGLYEVTPDTENFCRCVDGRYEGEALPPVARPGGTVGLYMALIAAVRKLGPRNVRLGAETLDAKMREALWEMVRKTVGADKNPKHVCFHTDDHNEKPGGGCGHIVQALENPSDYGLEPEDMKHIVGKLPELLAQGAHQDILSGKHNEGAVVIVESGNYSVKPQVRIGDNSSQVFVYQKTLDDRLLAKLSRQLTQYIQEHGTSRANEDTKDFMLRIQQAVMEASDKQLNETVSRLAKGLPVYRAEIDNGKTIRVSEITPETRS